MLSAYQFEEIAESDSAIEMEMECQNSLLSPQDGMWESFRKSSEYWFVKKENQKIGYYNLHQDFGLIQFYIKSDFENEANQIFGELIKSQKINKAIVGTNHPIFQKAANHFCKEKKKHTYLFELGEEIFFEEKQGDFRLSKETDLERIVQFCKISIGAPEEWLKKYVLDLIKKQEHYFLELNHEIIGISEVRKSISQKGIADIGMIVNPKFRRKGYGTYLLNKGKTIAIENQLKPICSCEVDNIGSFKSIQKCGFQSTHQLLKMTLG